MQHMLLMIASEAPVVHHKVYRGWCSSSVRLVKFLRQADDATHRFL